MPGVRTACSGGWVCKHSFFPGLKKCTPRQPREHVNQQAASCPRSANTSWWSCCHWILGKECTLTPSSRSESELLDLHVHRGPRPTFQENRGGLKKSKDKGKRPNQRRIAKRNERPSTHPEKNRQRPPDHQARRRSRKESQVAQNGRERVIGQHEENSG